MLNDLLDKTNSILNVISKKQQAHSANLANIHTPGYVKQSVDFKQYLAPSSGTLETKLTHKMGQPPLVTEKGGEIKAQEELVAMQKNFLFYTMSTRRVSSIIQELKTVAQLGK